MAEIKEGRYEDSELYRIRHSAAHVMAQAILEMFEPREAKIAIGPPVADGFYYDFELPRNLTPDDFETIEMRMRQIIADRQPFEKKEVSATEAREKFENQPYKLELIDGLEAGGVDEYGEPVHGESEISFYSHGSFTDLCRGPHVEHTGNINPSAIKLTSIAGAYWRGDENRPQLQRVYGTAWKTATELEEYLWQVEEAKKRDHRKLGKKLDIFTFAEEVGPGLPLWLPNGGVIIDELETLAKEVEDRHGYDRVRTPHLTKASLFERSGHLAHYADSMYPPMELDGQIYYVKPMNCPMHHKIFDARPKSYRDLPVRLAEFGTCYRYEKSGELFGLMRVRSMQMNDAHIYCTESDFESEFMDVIEMYNEYFHIFGIDKYVMRLSTHDKGGLGKKFVDNEALWEKTEAMVRMAMDHADIPYVEEPGEAAFYGPKIDVQVWSTIGREFTLATNQVDFAQPARFGLTFVNQDGEDETPLCIHRAPLSTHERMIGFLIEHFAGKFPVWLSPEQVRIIPITDDQHPYAKVLETRMKNLGARANADLGPERMNAKIRAAQKMQVPYMLVVGGREVEGETISLRTRDGERVNGMPLVEFEGRLIDRIQERSLSL